MPTLRFSLIAAALVLAARLPAAVPPALAAPPAPAVPEPSKAGNSKPAVADTIAAPVLTPEEEAAKAAMFERAKPRLKELVSRQDALLAALGREDADVDNLKRDIQTLVFDYDAFLRVFPNYAPGYVTYGLLLQKVGMRRESSVILLKANSLDPEIPIVKNQLGNYLAEEGEPLEAANYFIAAIRLAPREPLYHYQLGRLLSSARDYFLKSGQWDRAQIDRTMQDAFRKAMELAPDSFRYAYAYAESFYDISAPNWEEALKLWGALEDRAAPGLEKETIRLHAARVLILQGKKEHARMLLSAVTSEPLLEQKQKLLDQLAAKPEK